MRFHSIVLALSLFACPLISLAQEKAQQPATVQKAPIEMKQTHKDLSVVQDRQSRLRAAITTFDDLIRRKPPADLTPRQLAEWKEQTKWLKSVRDRYQKMDSAYAPANQRSRTIDTAKLNTEFLALQNAVQMESRKFQTLSNASKARHDIAMSAIRNTRA